MKQLKEFLHKLNDLIKDYHEMIPINDIKELMIEELIKIETCDIPNCNEKHVFVQRYPFFKMRLCTFHLKCFQELILLPREYDYYKEDVVKWIIEKAKEIK